MSIRLLFVGDGPRDEAAVPELVRTLLGTQISAEFEPWARLNVRGKGYERRLRYATRQARDRRVSGLVATVDRDLASRRQRLKELVDGRDAERQTPTPLVPTALGEANPHLEAWLLDDQVAVRRTLRLDGDHPLPNVRSVSSPKAELDDLHSRCSRCDEERLAILAEMAASVDHARCAHSGETGFKSFVEEVRTELGPLAVV